MANGRFGSLVDEFVESVGLALGVGSCSTILIQSFLINFKLKKKITIKSKQEVCLFTERISVTIRLNQSFRSGN